MYSNLKNIGIRNPEDIKRYSLRQEGESDILKIYFRKSAGMLMARSSKFKFQRQLKKVSGGQNANRFTDLSEINPTLHKIITELDKLTLQVGSEKELKQQVLSDLKHLQLVVNSKIDEIERKLEKLS